MLAKTFISTLLMVCTIAGVAKANNSPVFLWGVNSPSKPALSTVEQNDFAQLLKPLLKDNMVVAFLEEKLSSKDFLCSKSDSSSSCYAHMQGVSPKTYYANVQNPIEALRSVAKEREFNSVDEEGNLATPLKCGSGKVVFVNFDSNRAASRNAVLQGHDAAIESISKEQKDCNVVYLYLSTPSNQPSIASSHRVRRETAAPKGGYIFRKDSQFLLFFTKLVMLTPVDGKIQSEELVVNSMTVTNFTTNNNNDAAAYKKFAVTLDTASAKQVKFNISLSGGYFSMSNVIIDSMTFRSSGLDAPTDFSFSCGNLTMGAVWPKPTEPVNTVLRWDSLQFQAPFNSKYTNKFVFGDAWSCTGFFTPAILSGLFVVVIMMIILFVGVCWMMDINTMDRFDDPKGKTITINAAE